MRQRFQTFAVRKDLMAFFCAMLISLGPVFAQNITVTGVVLDSETGTPLIGAVIQVAGTSTAAASGTAGRFSLQAPVDAVLEVTFLGYEKKIEHLGGRTNITIELATDAFTAEEIVVVGYGTQKKVNLTGAVAVVNVNEALSSRSISNVSTALSGLVPGLMVQATSGMAGDNGAELLIRGLNSVNGGSPLIVVDGMPDVDINRINMNDIQSISVLKDASSAAIYGSRAANGVILITTKTGREAGKVSIDYTGSLAFGKPTSAYNILVDYPKALTLHQRSSAAGRGRQSFMDGTIDEWMHMGMIDPIRYPSENQLDWVTRNYYLRQHNISAAGSGEKYNFYISAGLMNEDAYMINNDYKRYNFRTNVEYKIRKNITVGTRIDGQWSDMTFAYANGFVDRSSDNMPISVAITGLYPYDKETDRYGGVMAEGEAQMAQNLYANYSTRRNERQRQEFNGNIFVEYEPIPGLTARLDYSLRYYNQFQKHYLTPTGLNLYNFQNDGVAWEFISPSSGITNQTWQGYKTLTQFRLGYNKEVVKGHEISAVGVYVEEYWFDRSFYASRANRVHTNITEINGALTTTQTTGGNSSSEGLRSYVGRLNYVGMDRYLAEFSFRVDGSSRFVKGHQYTFFPSGSLGWRFSEEEFFKPLKRIVNSGKFRASHGTLGSNAGVSRDAQKDVLATTPYALNGNNLVQGFSVRKMINLDLTWEKTRVTNFGFDFGFFRNRFTVELDYYDRKTIGMIWVSQLSSLLSAYEAPIINGGNLRNKGIELNMTWKDHIRDFQYGANFNFSFNRDQLESWVEERSPSKVFVGMPYYFNYVRTAIGIAQSWEDIYNAPYQNNSNISPGDLIYEDLNGDGQITGADKKAYPKINEHRPTAYYGLTLYGSWKGFDVNMVFTGATGRKNYWGGTGQAMNSVHIGEQRHAWQEWHWYDTWNLDNRFASNPRVTTGNTPDNIAESTFWLSSMNYLRMKNLQIGYNIPQKILKKVTLAKFRVYFSAENLFTITGWKGLDPEKKRFETLRNSPVIKDDPYPIMKTMSIGLNIGF